MQADLTALVPLDEQKKCPEKMIRVERNVTSEEYSKRLKLLPTVKEKRDMAAAFICFYGRKKPLDPTWSSHLAAKPGSMSHHKATPRSW